MRFLWLVIGLVGCVPAGAGDDGDVMYVTGLERTSGAVGVDGPVYTVDLNAALH